MFTQPSAVLKRSLLLLLPSVLLVGCTPDFVLPIANDARLVIYDGRRAIYEAGLTTDSPELVAVNQWLAANLTGWRYGFMTRDPMITVQASQFSMNILKAEATIKYCHGFLGCHFWIKNGQALFGQEQKIHAERLTAGKNR